MSENYLITSEYSVPLDLKPHAPGAEREVPVSIQYMPAGKSTITPSVNGEAKQISVTVNQQTADVLQSELAQLLTQNVRPFIDFEHAGGRAAAIPKRFFWEEGQGVMLELDWTNSGKNAVGGRDYSYFSPTFMLNEKGDPSGLPKSGAIGSLVNNPAFRDFKPIYAHQAGYFDAEGHIYFTDDAGYHTPHKEFYVPELATLIAAQNGDVTGNQTKQKDTMSDKITAKLVSLGFITEADASDPEKVTAALELYSRKGSENAELATLRAENKTLRETAETQRVEAINRDADLLIEAAVKDGKIAPKNETVKASLKRWAITDLAGAKAHIESLPVNPAFKTVVTVTSAHRDVGKPKDTKDMNGNTGKQCDAKTRQVQARFPAGQMTYEAAWKIAAAEFPEVFETVEA